MTTFTVYFDLETGGLQPHHPTIELAAVAVDRDGNEVACFEQKIAFDETSADPEALKLNHYERDAWAEAVNHPTTAIRFARWLKPYCCVTLTSKKKGTTHQVARLAGYNALTFDAPRLRTLFAGQFTPWELRVRDVLQRALFWFDEREIEPENYKLTTIAAYFGIPTDGAHGALADARMCAKLAKAMREGR